MRLPLSSPSSDRARESNGRHALGVFPPRTPARSIASITFFLLALLALPCAASADCLPFAEAPQHIGKTACVRGEVVNIGEGPSGTLFLNFCQDYRTCPFTVVVFPRDRRHVGDVRRLQGKVIEVHGEVREYDGRAEIILRRARQLRGKAARLPPPPSAYDADRRGRHRAGEFKPPKPPRSSRRTRRQALPPAAATEGAEQPPAGDPDRND